MELNLNVNSEGFRSLPSLTSNSVSLPDVQIGKTSISELRMISSPALSNEIRRIIPYLELCTNHAYLIERLETLSSGGYLSKYVWDGGQEFNGRPWSKENPTDSAILVHLLSCWLDTHLPPDPAAGPEARACTDRFIRKAKPGKLADQYKNYKKIYLILFSGYKRCQIKVSWQENCARIIT